MPKIIENAQQMILQEARRQVTERGYSAMTMKSVAAACGLAVGTLYNYYPSKDVLVASFMLEDWQACLARMAVRLEKAEAPRELLAAVHEGLFAFIREHAPLFSDPGAGKSSAAGFPARHQLLRGQLAAMLAAPVRRLSPGAPSFLPDFLAESLLSWAGTDTEFETLCRVMTRLF